MARVIVDNDQLLDMLVDRVRFWENDEDVINLYRDMYKNLIDANCFEDCKLDIPVIVDNDVVYYCIVYFFDDLSESDRTKLIDLIEGDNMDISKEEFEDISGQCIEAFNKDEGLVLVRIY